MDYPHKLWMTSSKLNHQLHTIWGIKLYSRNPKTVAYETESVSFKAPKIWSIVPQELKNSQSLYSFKKGIRKWKPTVHIGYAKPTCNILVLYNNQVLHWNKNRLLIFFILSSICYIIDYFLFLLYFSPLKGRYWLRNKMVSWFITAMNLQTNLYLSFSRILLGGWR